jgi:predicted nucleic acid-binding protein
MLAITQGPVLIIAAHAAETGRTIISRDAMVRFADLPTVTAIDANTSRPAPPAAA